MDDQRPLPHCLTDPFLTDPFLKNGSSETQSGVRKGGGKGGRMGGGAEMPRVTHDFLAAMISWPEIIC